MTHGRLNVLSLFDGMSGGQIALKELGIIPDVYHASEIDKHAIKQTQLNFPNTIQLGSVIDVDVSKLEPINLLLGGSPCQSFSFAGKRNGMSTVDNEEIYTLERYLELKNEGFEFVGESYLFWEYMRILTDIRKYNPDVLFLLENVEMGKKWERVLSEAIGIYGVHINSNLVSAQNRARVYWTNIGTRREGLFGELHSDIPQPEDEGIFLRDILEKEVDEKYYLSEKIINGFLNRKSDWVKTFNPISDTGVKAKTINSRLSKMGMQDNYISINGEAPTQRCSTGGSLDAKHNYQFIKLDTKGNVKSNQDKASCITGAGGHGAGNHSDMDLICVAQRGRNTDNPKSRKTGLPTVQMLETNLSGKSNALTTIQKDNLILQRPRGNNQGGIFEGKTPTVSHNAWEQNNLVLSRYHEKNLKDVGEKANSILATSHKGAQANGMTLVNEVIQLNPSTESGGVQPYQQNRVYADYGKSPAHMAQMSCGAYAVESNSRIRRLTPTEVSRLQTVPDWYKWECSDTQIYKMCGNGWTINVIRHILSFMNLNK